MFRVPRGRFARALFTAVVALTLLAIPATVAAHAELDTMTPADKSTAQGSPAEIVATFTEDHLAPTGNSLVLLDSAGTIVAQGGTVSADKRTLSLELPSPLAAGAYSIRWTSRSAEDGDVARGTTTFTVAAAASPSATPVASASPSSESSVAPSVGPSVAPTPSPSAAPAPATSTGDAVIPIVVALIVLAAIGAWLFRGRFAGRR